MAIYHLHVSMVKRSSGRSSVAAAAYRSAEKLKSEHDNVTHDYSPKSSSVNASAYRSGEKLGEYDYTRKQGVVHTEILLPENAPQEYADRATLWNAVEQSEKRRDAQTARDIDIALPIEFDRQEQIMLVRDYVKENFVDKGMCADFAIHDKEDGNPHAHILLTTREVTEKGFCKKNRDWNSTKQLKEWRENWANACNKRLREFNKHIDHRTLKAQGIEREPTIHVGVVAKYMERKGFEHPRAKKNREIIARNTARRMHQLKEGYISLDKQVVTLQNEVSETRREMNSLRIRAEEITERAGQIIATGNEQARAYFKRTYKIAPEQAEREIKRLEQTAESKRHLQDKLQAKITPLIEERERFLLDYQRQKVYIELNPDKQQIYDYLETLEKNRPQRQSVKDNLARVRCESMLDTITERKFQAIVKQAPPEKAQALIERYERERERERMRTFQRGRS